MPQDLEYCILGLRKWLPEVSRGHSMRRIVNERKLRLAGLRYINSTANFFAPVIASWADVCLAVAGQPWRTTMKPVSWWGVDVHKDRTVNYWTFQYRVVVHLWGFSGAWGGLVGPVLGLCGAFWDPCGVRTVPVSVR